MEISKEGNNDANSVATVEFLFQASSHSFAFSSVIPAFSSVIPRSRRKPHLSIYIIITQNERLVFGKWDCVL